MTHYELRILAALHRQAGQFACGPKTQDILGRFQWFDGLRGPAI
ncbi:MAG: hypothetical protein ACTS1Z_14565 [Parasphingopyxis sp.]